MKTRFTLLARDEPRWVRSENTADSGKPRLTSARLMTTVWCHRCCRCPGCPGCQYPEMMQRRDRTPGRSAPSPPCSVSSSCFWQGTWALHSISEASLPASQPSQPPARGIKSVCDGDIRLKTHFTSDHSAPPAYHSYSRPWYTAECQVQCQSDESSVNKFVNTFSLCSEDPLQSLHWPRGSQLAGGGVRRRHRPDCLVICCGEHQELHFFILKATECFISSVPSLSSRSYELASKRCYPRLNTCSVSQILLQTRDTIFGYDSNTRTNGRNMKIRWWWQCQMCAGQRV